ncbi:alpha/beta hydrolase fold domain-containing protein [Amycolatopsis sp. cg13]|uniref:alpha/beta hydrolase fold domain-containing protein n=1 Tax=Amycolatopsis sp. cg13 TaxID=3238807 RepID=UPI0035240F90
MTHPAKETPGDPLEVGWRPPPFLPPGEPAIDSEGVRRYEHVTYAQTTGYRPVLMDVHVPASAEPVGAVVWLHGGAWLDGDRRYPPPTIDPDGLFGGIVRAGLALVRVDYRHSLESPFPAQLHDGKAAVRYVREFAGEFGIDPGRIGVWGESAGGHLAMLLALTGDSDPALEGIVGVTAQSSEVQAVVNWYGVADVAALLSRLHSAEQPDPCESLLGPRRDQWPALARAASPLAYLTPGSGPRVPMLVQHGTADSVVPFDHSERLAAALEAAGTPVTFVPVPDADHCFVGSPDVPAIVARGIGFLRDALAPERPPATVIRQEGDRPYGNRRTRLAEP